MIKRYSDGSTYIGDLSSEGKRHGEGCLTYYKDSGRYEGQWRSDMFHGFGRYFYSDGKCYIGEFYNGKRHGSGILQYPNGDAYDGKWQFNKQEGRGTFKNSIGKAGFLNKVLCTRI
jgi:hypothetical protein